MQSKFWILGRVTLGLLTGAVCALPQAYTISAKPGAVNYIEGPASVNGTPITANAKRVFVNVNDTLETASGSKAEMLLTPGVFVRLGSDSAVKMISASLTDTQVEVTRGEVVVEVAEFEKANNISVLDHGAATRILKIGLYRFTAEPAVAQVMSGKAAVTVGDRQVDLNKDHEIDLANDLKARKFQSKSAEDDLYAWSKVRDEYVSAASYSAAKNISTNSSFMNYGGYPGYGYSGLGGAFGPGWFWNAGWNSWAWLPGEGAFFSPFGFGYYSPYSIAYAPVVYLPVNGTRPVPVPVIPGKPIRTASGTTTAALPGGGRPMAAGFPARINNGHISSTTLTRSAEPASRGGQAGYSGRGYSGGGNVSSRSAPMPSAPAPMSSGGVRAPAPAGHR